MSAPASVLQQESSAIDEPALWPRVGAGRMTWALLGGVAGVALQPIFRPAEGSEVDGPAVHCGRAGWNSAYVSRLRIGHLAFLLKKVSNPHPAGAFCRRLVSTGGVR